MRFKKTFIVFAISIILLNLSLVFAINSNKSKDKYLRIHVVANSDSIDDQLLKYTLSKQINEYITELTKECTTKQECKEIIQQHMKNILSLCDTTLKDNNSNYIIKAYLGKQLYEEKQMDNFYMRPGIYDSLKIIIGSGQGQNWWSLIYPTTFSGNNNEDIFAEDTKYSFGIIELIQNLFI